MRELTLEPDAVLLREAGKTVAREALVPGDEGLREALRRIGTGRSAAPTRVRIASHHARLLLLPWVPQLTSAERWHALAASRFEQSFDESPEHWLLRVADDAPPRPRLAAALPSALVRAVQDTFKPRRMAIGLLDALGTLLAREPSFHGCVAEIGSHSACLLMLCNGVLKRVRMRRHESPDEAVTTARAEWAASIAREGDDAKSTARPVTVALLGAASSASSLASALGSSRILQLA